MSIRELNLQSLGESLGITSLCWRCSKSQNFYANPCLHCGAINPNVDLDGALAQQSDAQRAPENGGESQ
jgi:hypothetical protein